MAFIVILYVDECLMAQLISEKNSDMAPKGPRVLKKTWKNVYILDF